MKEYLNKTAGIYIHIPFCRKKCGYCDFYTISNLSIITKYINNLKKEIILYNKLFNDYVFDTIYFGGGTPSILESSQLEEILNTLHKYFHISSNIELTLEVNPEDIINKTDYIKELKSFGINRISYGVQSFNKKHLIFLDRYCDTRNIRIALEMILNEIKNVNVDVIHSIPGMEIKDLSLILEYLIKIGVPHISTYSLIYEKETLLYTKVEKKTIKPLDSDKEYKQYKFIKEKLEQNNYVHYEISNFAVKGYESKHNLKYWNFENYLGLGVSSHSLMNLVRWNNYRNIIKYNIDLKNEKLPIERKIKLTKPVIEMELIYLGLRSKGVNLEKFNLYTGTNFSIKYRKAIDTLIKSGFAELEQGNFKLTREGLFLADEIMVKYF